MLKGKIAWITGAGTGIGLAGAKALARAGAEVVMSGRRADVLEREGVGIRRGGGRAEAQPPEGWDEVVRVNLDGTFYCVRAVLPLMRAQKDGVIINISSWAGVHTSALV